MNRPRAEFLNAAIAFTVNGRKVSSRAAPIARLADVLRDELGLTGTKVGCNAGDCGACTVLLDDRQVCSCLTALGQVHGREVVTVEGLARTRAFRRFRSRSTSTAPRNAASARREC
jgi:aldehyde oxidoreductase